MLSQSLFEMGGGLYFRGRVIELMVLFWEIIQSLP